MSGDPGFLVLSANTPWVYALAANLSGQRSATAMRFYDALSWRRERPTWPAAEALHLRRAMRVLPPGYAGRFERLFRPLMQAIVGDERRRLRRQCEGVEPYVVAPYPYLEPWLRGVPDERLIYYSLDEYAFYDPPRAALIHAQEDAIVARAGLTVCLSNYQAEVLRRRHPARAADIRHFPLGVENDYLNPAPEEPPRPRTVGYVGNLTDRVNWTFVAAVAAAAPSLTFEFVGSLTWLADGIGVERHVPNWKRARDEALALPNVHHRGSVPQAVVPPFYWNAAVNWMPYDIRHGFNLASCPTKIMDALASGRPFASTSVPECLLYPGMIHLADGPVEMAALLVRLADDPGTHAAEPLAFAHRQRWANRAATLLEMVRC